MAQDQDCIAAVIDAFYEAISGPSGQDCDWGSIAALFASGASILSHRGGAAGALSVDEYVERLRSSLTDRDFYERGLDYRIEIHGDIAQVRSRYEASFEPEFSEIRKMGTNLIQLVRDEGVWMIASMVYQDD